MAIVQEELPWYGSNNEDLDPEFVEPTDDDFHLACTSPALDRGLTSALPEDQFDFDGDLNFTEAFPLDLDRDTRVQGINVTMGVYETAQITPCAADFNDDDKVNVSDLLSILANWGTCPTPPAACPWDIKPDCVGDGDVGVTELLLLLATWSDDCATGAPGIVPETVQDCLNMYSDPAEQEACIEALNKKNGTE